MIITDLSAVFLASFFFDAFLTRQISKSLKIQEKRNIKIDCSFLGLLKIRHNIINVIYTNF